jgi:hypothetical protein
MSKSFFIFKDRVENYVGPNALHGVNPENVVGGDEAMLLCGEGFCKVAVGFTPAEQYQMIDLIHKMEKLMGDSWARQNPAPATPVPPGTSPYDPARFSSGKAAPKTGHTCARCQSYNEYASANRPDGTYVCFGCRP